MNKGPAQGIQDDVELNVLYCIYKKTELRSFDFWSHIAVTYSVFPKKITWETTLRIINSQT